MRERVPPAGARLSSRTCPCQSSSWRLTATTEFHTEIKSPRSYRAAAKTAQGNTYQPKF